MEAGGHAWDDKVKKGYLKAALNQTLREKMVVIEEKDTYEGFCAQVKGVADRLTELQRLNGNRAPQGPHAASKGNGNNGNKGDFQDSNKASGSGLTGGNNMD